MLRTDIHTSLYNVPQIYSIKIGLAIHSFNDYVITGRENNDNNSKKQNEKTTQDFTWYPAMC